MIEPELAGQAVRLALERGATDAECTLAEGEEFSAHVRMRALETLKDAGSRRAGLRVLVGKRVGSAHTSDLSSAACARWWNRRWPSPPSPPKIRTPDLPDASELGVARRRSAALFGRHSTASTRPRAFKRRSKPKRPRCPGTRASPTPRARRSARIRAQRVFANSRGFLGSYRTSSCSLSATPVAREGDSMERDFWYSSARSHSKLESPAAVGRRAAERTVRRLGAAQSPDAESAGDLRFRHRAVAARQYLRSGGGRFHLSQRVVPGGKTGRARGVRERDHHRRRRPARAVRHVAVR